MYLFAILIPVTNGREVGYHEETYRTDVTLSPVRSSQGSETILLFTSILSNYKVAKVVLPEAKRSPLFSIVVKISGRSRR